MTDRRRLSTYQIGSDGPADVSPSPTPPRPAGHDIRFIALEPKRSVSPLSPPHRPAEGPLKPYNDLRGSPDSGPAPPPPLEYFSRRLGVPLEFWRRKNSKHEITRN